jgi:V/A-type H+/Na+-transporting ATPase subunit G/H
MNEIIQKIIATETEAKTITAAARAEAEQILLNARKIGQDMIERAHQEVRIEAERIVNDAVKEAEQEKKKLLARAAGEIEGQIRLDHARKQWAVEGVVRCVCAQQ